MSKISIITDSTANLPKELIEKYNLTVIPLNIQWGDDSYLDSIDMTAEQFYERLERDPNIPTTSQPAAQKFLDTYKRLAETSDGIFVALISSGISGTVDSAMMAAAEFDAIPVEVCDSKLTASGLAVVVILAAEAASQGKSLTEIAQMAKEASKNTRLFFMVDTLKYLHRGGRIGGASKLLGSALNIKPILELNTEGKIDSLEKVRTRKKALDRMVEICVENAHGKPSYIGVLHANAAGVADEVAAMIRAKVDTVELYIMGLSPVIGTHVGPGTIGISVLPKE